MTTIFKTPFLLVHPEVYALLSGAGNTLRWQADGESFFISVDDRYGRMRFRTPRRSLFFFRELAEGYFSPSYKPRFYGDVTWFNYQLVRDSAVYVAVVKIVPRSVPKGMSISSSQAWAQALIAKARSFVGPKIYRRSGTVRVPRSTSLRPSVESDFPNKFDDVYEGNLGGYFITHTLTPYETRRREWTGVRTPNFGRLKKAQLPVNPHTVLIREFLTDTNAEWWFRKPSDWTMYSTKATYHYIQPPVPSHLTLARFLALRRLIDRGQLGIDANIAQDFAQLGQTTRLIGDTAFRLVGSLSALRRGNVLQAAEILWQGKSPRYPRGRFGAINGTLSNQARTLANNWLMLQYGWKPLLNDVHGALQSLKVLSTSSNFIQVVTASGKATSSDTKSLGLWPEPGIVGGSEVTMTQTRCKLRLRYKIDDRLKAFLAQMGFTNPVNLAWEIIPFSFVADWFFPLGPFLETLSSWDGLVFVDGSQTLFTRSQAVLAIDYHGMSKVAPLEYREAVARRTVRTILLNRTKFSSFPTQSIPSFKNGLASVTHALNGLALLAKYFR